MMTLNKIMLWCVAVMAVAFTVFPQQIMGVIMPGSNQTFTDDMVRTVLHVKGMT